MGVCGLLSTISDLRFSIAGKAGVILRELDGVGERGAEGADGVEVGGGFFGAAPAGTSLPCIAHCDCSTAPPARQMATSASSAAMYLTKEELVAFALCSSALSSSGESSALTRAEFLMDLARIPKRSVDSVSCSL